MSENHSALPPRLREIVEDFEISEGREKLELLIEFSEQMPPLPEWLASQHDQMDQVQECMTPVFVQAETKSGQDGQRRMSFTFDVPPESPTVRGYAAILAEGLDGATPEEILNVPNDFFRQMGLDQVLSHQRLNGIVAILAHIKRLASLALQD